MSKKKLSFAEFNVIFVLALLILLGVLTGIAIFGALALMLT